MVYLNITNPLTLFLAVLAIGLLIFLGQEIKKSSVAMIPLVLFLFSLIAHVVQVSSLSQEYAYLSGVLYRSIVWDFVFILITFFSYLWIDDLEAKKNNKKSIDNSLEWFWREI
jgi:hypothetical protein